MHRESIKSAGKEQVDRCKIRFSKFAKEERNHFSLECLFNIDINLTVKLIRHYHAQFSQIITVLRLLEQ